MKIKPLHLDGITYTPEQIDSLCQPLLDVRDILVKQQQWQHAIALSCIHALLKHLKEHTNDHP